MAAVVPRFALFIALTLLAAAPARTQQQPGPVTPAGQQLATLLDGMNVETLWQRGYHIDWRTGIAKGPPETAPGGHTHCSAFAAAVAERLGVYLLHPPEHPQIWLANAQERWLNSAAATGWQRIGTLSDPGASLNAVALANAGKLVLAVYFQPPRSTPNGPEERSGHVAIVRPSNKSAALIIADGPDVIQAGMHNYQQVAMRIGFASHKAGWSNGAIEYFWHPPLPRSGGG
jgi:hypothetical protein